MVVIYAMLGIVVVAVIAMLFAFMAIFAARRMSPGRRALFSAGAAAVPLTLPAYFALAAASVPVVSFVGIAVGTAIMTAVAYPLALLVTRRRPVEPDPSVFD